METAKLLHWLTGFLVVVCLSFAKLTSATPSTAGAFPLPSRFIEQLVPLEHSDCNKPNGVNHAIVAVIQCESSKAATGHTEQKSHQSEGERQSEFKPSVKATWFGATIDDKKSSKNKAQGFPPPPKPLVLSQNLLLQIHMATHSKTTKALQDVLSNFAVRVATN